jgi:hypothetical protein
MNSGLMSVLDREEWGWIAGEHFPPTSSVEIPLFVAGDLFIRTNCYPIHYKKHSRYQKHNPSRCLYSLKLPNRVLSSVS